MKNVKNYMGFLFIKNIANFEAFWGVKKLSANHSFFKCDTFSYQVVVKDKDSH